MSLLYHIRRRTETKGSGGPKREKLTGSVTKLHNKGLHDLYLSNTFRITKSRKMRWVGQVVRVRDSRRAYRISVGKPEGKRP